jgi:hypothetical protein
MCQTIDLDVDENGVVDFEFFYDVFENEPFLHINVPASLQMTNKIVVTGEHNTFGKDLVAKLPAGIYVGEGLEYNGQIFGNGPLLAQPSFAGFNILEGRGPSIVGFSFDRDGEIHYGWMRLEVNAAGTRIETSTFVFETIPGRKVQTSDPASVELARSSLRLTLVDDRLYEANSDILDVRVSNLLGIPVAVRTTDRLLDLKACGPGAYFVRLRTREGELLEKVVLR